MLDRKVAPLSHKIEKINIPQAEKSILDNGIPVYFIKAGKQPVLRLELIFKAGTWFEQKKGASYFATKMLSEGTKSKTSAHISNEIEKFGAFLNLNASLDFAVITLECLAKHLERLLPLVNEIIYQSTFPEEEYVTLQNIRSQQIRVNNEKTSILASNKFRETLFGHEHPYGKDLSLADIEKLEIKDVTAFYEHYFKSPFEIVVAGLPEQNLLNALNTTFGQVALKRNDQLFTYAQNFKTGPTLIEKESSIQSSIRIGKRLFTKDHPDLIDMLVLNEILGGYFGSRLMKNIREDKGYTYGISSAVITLKHEGYFILGTDVNKENTANTLEEIYKEIAILQTTAVPTDELNTVKNFMVGSFLSEINTPFALADKFKAVHLNGMDYSYYSHYIQRINNITPNDIKTIANKYLDKSSFSEVVVGGYE